MNKKIHLVALLCSTFLASGGPLVAAIDTPVASALELHPDGWIDLMAENGLESWQRERFRPDRELSERNPWSFDPASGVVTCEATGIHEMLLHKEQRGDGIMRVEFRYTGEDERPNSGIFVRTLADASVWHQAQLAPNGLGVFFGQFPGPDGAPKRLRAGQAKPELLRAAPEWNEIEVTASGSNVSVWINGYAMASTDECSLPLGHVGLEAEFHPIQFRNIKFRPAARSE
jgi:hypothetical protein